VSCADAALILAKGNVQDPVHGVLDAPVQSNGDCHLLGAAVQAGNEVPRLGRRLVEPFGLVIGNGSFGFYADEGLEVLPVLVVGEFLVGG